MLLKLKCCIISQIISAARCMKIQLNPALSKGNRKKFEMAGFRNNQVVIKIPDSMQLDASTCMPLSLLHTSDESTSAIATQKNLV